MTDKETYDGLASQLERGLNENSRVEWNVDDYDMRLREAQASDETARDWSTTTPAAYFDLIFDQMKIWYTIEWVTASRDRIESEKLRGYYYVSRALVEDAVDCVAIIRQLIAEQIALKLTEAKIV